MTNLPQDWEWKSLGEILSNDKYSIKRGPFGSALKKSFFVENGIRVFEQYNAINNDPHWKRYFISYDKFKELEAFKAIEGDLLISCSGTLGKIVELPKHTEIGIINQALLKIRLDNTKILNSYFIYNFNSPIMQGKILESTLGSAIKNIASVKILKQIKIPLPPLKEQERIVGILDESFAKIDESIKILEQNLLNLDELMQSALQKAFNPLKDNAKENYKLPQGWEWKSLEEISENISAGGDKPKNCTESKTAKNQIPVYANGVNNNGLVGYTDKATIIKPSLTISARGTIGFVCIRKEPYFPIVRLISLIPCENILCLHYLYFCLNFFIAKGEGSSIPQLTIPKFKSLQIPLPPLKEQEQIAKHLDFVFEKTKALKELYTKELKDYEELKQSLLNKAFKGEL
ncbi:restriction endonuclease subunit S [Campylobacter jejuni]|uniref:Restriction endonuclease subunit S n=1 Tax=Campylobacter jejuni TaxID=197 RepID=A0A6C7SQD5_CAMJU|nr:restriction endonuclease subunit S [Campylobacter jejuni]MBX0488390.1 restriction endonuclease subunit S [Campylobacter coli]EAI5454105.1 restriction endonuclease subunit S [Campylobacter jejuni]EAI7919100.1 restriction endonuclease subunit S [Campylobacter jejuni]EAJ0828663.1 restriction endonuclease subunit S [Campylobacter jejuni]EAL7071548.1 restriction endonuclease subunit S [Campylobacter jejuni]